MSRRPRVLVVDDERPVLEAVRRALRPEPFDVEATADPREALRRLREGAVDLLLVDFKMPGLDGSDLLRLASEISPGTARVLITGYPGESVVLRSASRATCVLEKPWTNVSLISAMREALREKGLDGGPKPTT